MWRKPSLGTTPARRACTMTSRSRGLIGLVLDIFHRRRLTNHMMLDGGRVAVFHQGIAMAVESPFIYGLQGAIRHQLMRARQHIKLRPGPGGARQQFGKKALVAAFEPIESQR